MKRKDVCVDLDGVLAYYDTWKGLDHIGDPIPGAKEFLETIAEHANVVIFTTRGNGTINRPEGVEDVPQELAKKIKTWLDKHGMTYHTIYTGQGKPLADAYVDDRAVTCRPQEYSEAYSDAWAQVKKYAKLEIPQ